MPPITFEARKTIPRTAAEIASEIADTARWREFHGYAILPGIESAEYERRTQDMTGSRVRVRNRDGSDHVEEIIEWDAENKIVIRLHEFSAPLNRLATHFVEEWNFEAKNNATLVTRKFQMFPRQSITRPLLWLISLFFRRAVALHLDEMASTADIDPLPSSPPPEPAP